MQIKTKREATTTNSDLIAEVKKSDAYRAQAGDIGGEGAGGKQMPSL